MIVSVFVRALLVVTFAGKCVSVCGDAWSLPVVTFGGNCICVCVSVGVACSHLCGHVVFVVRVFFCVRFAYSHPCGLACFCVRVLYWRCQ